MKKMVMVGVAAAALMTGCANMNMGTFGGNSKYYQMLSPLSDEPIVQVAMASDQACRYMVNNVGPELKAFVRCSGQNVADALPWRAVIYNPSMASSFVMDAITEEACQSTLTGIEKTATETKSGAKVVMPCTKK